MLYYLGQSRLSFLSPPPTPALALEGVFIATIRSCKILLLGPFSPRRRLLHRSTPSCRTSSGKSFYPTTLLTTQPLSQASPGVTYNHRDSPKGIIPGTRVYLNLLLGPQPRFGDKLLRTWAVRPKNGTAVSPINPFKAAFPLWGQTTWNLSGLSPKWYYCGSKRVNSR